MKKLYTFLVLAFTVVVGSAQIVNIPDANFKAKLLAASSTASIAYNATGTRIKIDTNNDGNIQLSEALTVHELNISNSMIGDLTGVEAFTNLTTLDCSFNQIAALNNINTLQNLRNLYCFNNQITALDNLNGLLNLQVLRCHYNQITALNNLNGLQNLTELTCNNNQISSLDNLSGLQNLTGLNCGSNQISALDNLGSLQNLTGLGCSNNQITALDNLNSLQNLTILDCSSNQITSLNNLNNLQNLSGLLCDYNYISVLNLSSLQSLSAIRCSHNEMTSLNVNGLTNLRLIACNDNNLQTLDLNGLTLEYLFCSYNQITSLELSVFSGQLVEALILNHNLFENITLPYCILNDTFHCDFNPNLTVLNIKDALPQCCLSNVASFSDCPNLEYLCVNEQNLSEAEALIASYGYNNCTVNTYCSFTPGGIYYTIQGNNLYDNNNNGCDVLDINIPNLKFVLSDSSGTGYLIANNSGSYIAHVVEGTNTLNPQLENPSYFTVSPATATVTFPTAASPFIQDFCVVANGVHNDLEVAILPINAARPGFDANYKIIYKNKGTNTQSGWVHLAFDDTKMDLVSAIPTNTNSSTNSLSWAFSNLQPFETREIHFTMNINSPTEIPAVNGGDVLNFTANIIGLTDETIVDNTSTLNQTVVNSYDPNDKTCIEGTTVSPSTVGQYVHYVIRFENTGTANAHNIVVKDIIDTTKYDISSLVPLSGSASYVTRITNTNQVEFIFENINLPFDDANNDGYVAFKIKTKPTLVVGDTFSNSANIYFDYNFPITTNTYTTTITTLGTQDFEFSSVFSLSPVPAKNVLTISTKQSVAISSINIYNTLGQLLQVITNTNETIDVSSLKTGSYFIKIVSDQGTASNKFIKE